MLTFGRERKREYYANKDLDYFEHVISENNKGGIHHLVYVLPEYLSVNPPRVLAMVLQLFDKKVNYNNQGMMLRMLFEEENTIGVNPEIMKDFLFKDTINLTLDHDFDSGILYLESKFGFDTVLDFLVHKFAYFHDKEEGRGSYIGYYYHNPSISVEEREDRFVALISNFLEKDISKFKDIFKILRPLDGFTESLAAKLKVFAESLYTDKQKLLSLMGLLKEVDLISDSYLSFIAEIGNHLSSNHSATKEELQNLFPWSFYHNLGSKGKSANAAAFPVDIQKQTRLKDLIASHSLSPLMNTCFHEILANVTKSIEQDVAESKKSNDFD